MSPSSSTPIVDPIPSDPHLRQEIDGIRQSAALGDDMEAHLHVRPAPRFQGLAGLEFMEH